MGDRKESAIYFWCSLQVWPNLTLCKVSSVCRHPRFFLWVDVTETKPLLGHVSPPDNAALVHTG